MEKIKRFRVYSSQQPFTVPANARISDSFTIQDTGDFFCYYITGSYSSNDLLFQLRIANFQFFDKMIKIDLLAGTGQNSLFLPVNIIIKKKESVNLEFQNLTGTNINVYIAFIGYEI